MIVTSDNPRSEDPRRIVDEITRGLDTDVEVELDRKRAIERAIETARAEMSCSWPAKGTSRARRSRGVRLSTIARSPARSFAAGGARVIPLELDEVASAWEAATRPGASAATGVQIDSRRVVAGDLFVVVGGEAFVDDARSRGAAATPAPRRRLRGARGARPGSPRPQRRRPCRITGSTGKTSTKDILAAICGPRRRTVAAEASYNNELGVPLTLCRLEPDTEICILELAMRGRADRRPGGHRPTIDRSDHERRASASGARRLARSGGRGKGRAHAALPPGGVAVVPDDFAVERRDIEVVRRGQPAAIAENGATRMRFDGRDVTFSFEGGTTPENAPSALHAARALGIEAEGLDRSRGLAGGAARRSG